MSDDFMKAECPDCGEMGEADEQADGDFVSYECPNGHFFMKKA